MSAIRCIYEPSADGTPQQPPFPASDQHPKAVRYLVGSYYVDAIDGEPTLAEIQAKLGMDQNSLLDAQIDAIYASKPFTQRSHTEMSWAIAVIFNMVNAKLDLCARAIAALKAGDASFTDMQGNTVQLAGFTVSALPDLTQNAGILESKRQIDATAALRRQKT